MKKLLLFLTFNCFAGSINTNMMTGIGSGGEQEVTLSTSSALVLAANPGRNYLIIQNNDPAINMYLKFDSAHTGAQKYILIPAGGNYEPYVVPIDAIYMEAASGSPVVTIISGTNL